MFFTLLLFSVIQQPNFKQKFVALLKRFKVSDEVGTQHITFKLHLEELQVELFILNWVPGDSRPFWVELCRFVTWFVGHEL